MKLSKKLREFLDESRKTDAYWTDHAKLEFSNGLEKQRRSAKLTYAAIAEKIGTSAAYITKIFRGDSNVTIETMVKLARATGGQLDIRIVDSSVAVTHWDLSSFSPKSKFVLVSSNTFTETNTTPANQSVFDWPKAA